MPTSTTNTSPFTQPPAHPPSDKAWTPSDLVSDPHADSAKPAKVRAMFAAIAHAYDLNNRVHSLWQDQLWRRFAVRKAQVQPNDHVLDVACGTGDLTLAFARTPATRIVGLDFTSEMLDIARTKPVPNHPVQSNPVQSSPEPPHRITFLQGDAQDLPFPDASFNVVSIAFGIRNVQDPARALREFRRVLKPAGRLIILEFAQPNLAPVRWFNNLYCQRIMPVSATLISRDRSGAYRYLPRSVETFMPPDDLKNLLLSVGLVDPQDWALSLGICRCYRASAKG